MMKQTRHPAQPSHGQRRGTVLIFSIGVLSVLALLAGTFTAISRCERNVSRNYVDHVRSMMLATSGVEMSVAKLAEELKDPTKPGSHTYYGEDLNENGKEDAGEDNDGDGWQTTTCPLAFAPHPSFMLVKHTGVPNAGDLIDVGGKKIGVSGILPGTYTEKGDLYAVKVTDLSQKINVNMQGHPHLAQVLGNLCEEIGMSRDIGDLLVKNAPYGSALEVRDKCHMTQAQLDRLINYITVYGWNDTKVINPCPLDKRIKRGLSPGTLVYTWEEVRPVKIEFPKGADGQRYGRCPVNINLAPKEVLVALIEGLTGFFLQEASRDLYIKKGYDILDLKYLYQDVPAQHGGHGRGSWKTASGGLGRIKYTTPISLRRARRIADAILAHRATKPFRTWQEFDKFLWNDLWAKGILARTEIDVMKANFNPCTNMNAFNPEEPLFQWVDKTDLKYWTTEFSLGPTGYYEVESIGRVLNSSRDVVAESKLLVDVKMFDIYRESTQKDFLYDFWKNGKAIKGDIISANRGAGKTKGNLSLAVFPELSRAEFAKDADYDGHISLAPRVSSGRGAAFRASYDARGLDADTGQARIPDMNGPYADRLVNQVAGSGAWKPGKLFPDGVYSELDSVPMYAFTPANPYLFSVSMWMKPHYFPEHSGRVRVFCTWQSKVKNAARRMRRYHGDLVMPLGIYSVATTHIEDMSEGGYEYQDPWDTPAVLAGGCVDHYEGAVATPCLNHLEHGHTAIERGGQMWGTMLAGGKWIHIGWIHNGMGFVGRDHWERPRSHHEDMDVLYVNGQKAAGIFGYQTGDVVNPTDYSGEPLRLGERRAQARINSVPDATIDQVLVWNGLQSGAAEQKILGEWNDGRFYTEDDATFTSQSIDLARVCGIPDASSVMVTSVAWTGFIPETLRNGRITVELLKASDRSPLPQSRMYNDAGGERVDVMTTEPIRYRVHFQPKVGGAKAVLDTLVLSDVTLTVTKGPQFLSWAWVAN